MKCQEVLRLRLSLEQVLIRVGVCNSIPTIPKMFSMIAVLTESSTTSNMGLSENRVYSQL